MLVAIEVTIDISLAPRNRVEPPRFRYRLWALKASPSKKNSPPYERPLEPASTTVPAAAAEQQNENYNDEKRVGIHVRLPSLLVLGNAAYCSLEPSALTSFSKSSGSKNHVETKALELDPKGLSYRFCRVGSERWLRLSEQFPANVHI
jgi:hypothetical protein